MITAAKIPRIGQNELLEIYVKANDKKATGSDGILSKAMKATAPTGSDIYTDVYHAELEIATSDFITKGKQKICTSTCHPIFLLDTMTKMLNQNLAISRNNFGS